MMIANEKCSRNKENSTMKKEITVVFPNLLYEMSNKTRKTTEVEETDENRKI